MSKILDDYLKQLEKARVTIDNRPSYFQLADEMGIDYTPIPTTLDIETETEQFAQQHPYQASLKSGFGAIAQGGTRSFADFLDILGADESSDKVKAVSDVLKTNLDEMAAYKEGDEEGMVGLWKSGNYGKAIDLGFRQTLQSAPISAMAVGGAMSGNVGLAISALTMGVPSYGTKLSELDDVEGMETGMKRLNSLGTATSEVVSEYLGSALGIKGVSKIVKKVGIDRAKAMVGKQISKKLVATLGGLWAAGALGEGVEEYANTIATNIIDKATGLKDDWNISEGALESFVSGSFSGLLMESPAQILGAKANQQALKDKYDIPSPQEAVDMLKEANANATGIVEEEAVENVTSAVAPEVLDAGLRSIDTKLDAGDAKGAVEEYAIMEKEIENADITEIDVSEIAPIQKAVEERVKEAEKSLSSIEKEQIKQKAKKREEEIQAQQEMEAEKDAVEDEQKKDESIEGEKEKVAENGRETPSLANELEAIENMDDLDEAARMFKKLDENYTFPTNEKGELQISDELAERWDAIDKKLEKYDIGGENENIPVAPKATKVSSKATKKLDKAEVAQGEIKKPKSGRVNKNTYIMTKAEMEKFEYKDLSKITGESGQYSPTSNNPLIIKNENNETVAVVWEVDSPTTKKSYVHILGKTLEKQSLGDGQYRLTFGHERITGNGKVNCPKYNSSYR